MILQANDSPHADVLSIYNPEPANNVRIANTKSCMEVFFDVTLFPERVTLTTTIQRFKITVTNALPVQPEIRGSW